MLGQENAYKNFKMLLRGAGFVILVIWVAVMSFSFVCYALGFSIPEILISSDFTIAGCGFSFLHVSVMNGRWERRGKAELTLSILLLLMGGSVLFQGVYVMLFETPNPFTYLCLIIGTALAVLGTKQIKSILK